MMKRLFTTAALAVGLAGCASAPPAVDTSEQEVVGIINKVNGYWQQHESPQKWAVLGYRRLPHRQYGSLPDHRQSGLPRYTRKTGPAQQVDGAKSTDKANWKYQYGETDEHVMFGDWQICFQTYADLYQLDCDKHRDPQKIARAREVMEYQMSTPNTDYWWWSDGLYMVMPVMTKMYNITGNRQYLDKLYAYFQYSNSIMYDSAEACTTATRAMSIPSTRASTARRTSGRAATAGYSPALAKVLKDLPKDDPHRAEYVAKFQGMAQALKKAQSERRLLDPQPARPAARAGPGNQRHRLLHLRLPVGHQQRPAGPREYLPVAQGLALPERRPRCRRTARSATCSRSATARFPDRSWTRTPPPHFGVGAFLLAGAELVRPLRRITETNGTTQLHARDGAAPAAGGVLAALGAGQAGAAPAPASPPADARAYLLACCSGWPSRC
jgi:unsaturated rhamnogalacturonyl hydrolase